ncbi:peptide chain release factor N(5)-glutamine methyltransferase [Cohnella abietis]|uniref:Release factor glutamine methyltransferase n=1 Tax=Cohnella abietis TaxID=2507935 RepID=A0A3T1DDS2_9BACL|nr:peptide chain release factor N(5)-glutamine methyltransferase [Cohnella abietis]BBI36243.1 release factor glutamine methyltransferase [Cohnella abietis]
MNIEHEPKPLTLGSAWREGAKRLRQADVEEADADAELLLLYLLGINKTVLLRDLREPFPETKLEEWNSLLQRKRNGEPVQYIIGEQYFYGRAFEVTSSVLIPRPETELLAEAILNIADVLWPASDFNEMNGLTLLDVGTGSGILAITMASERPNWRITASDLSREALAVAGRNAGLNGVEERIEFVQGDLLQPFIARDELDDPKIIDILVSNPPYIPSSDIPHLQREVKDHEPLLALDGGEDGLNPYRIMSGQLRQLPQLPRLVGWEVGAGQAEDVAELLRAVTDWDEIRFIKDYAGIDRHVIAIK